ncbi:MAG TPA: hypothetical protein VE778_00835 [Candidatus Bathyarchaeia archaeon]|nr:hypothetical protein [Candidatus Bathyarchaeia archaeon]
MSNKPAVLTYDWIKTGAGQVHALPKPVLVLFQFLPFSSLWISDLEFAALDLSFVDGKSARISAILLTFSEPPCSIAQMKAFLEKHSFSVVVSFVQWTHPSAQRLFSVEQPTQEVRFPYVNPHVVQKFEISIALLPVVPPEGWIGIVLFYALHPNFDRIANIIKRQNRLFVELFQALEQFPSLLPAADLFLLH